MEHTITLDDDFEAALIIRAGDGGTIPDEVLKTAVAVYLGPSIERARQDKDQLFLRAVKSDAALLADVEAKAAVIKAADDAAKEALVEPVEPLTP